MELRLNFLPYRLRHAAVASTMSCRPDLRVGRFVLRLPPCLRDIPTGPICAENSAYCNFNTTNNGNNAEEVRVDVLTKEPCKLDWRLLDTTSSTCRLNCNLENQTAACVADPMCQEGVTQCIIMTPLRC